jgi:hypothetical protein
MGVDNFIISRLENGKIDFTPYYRDQEAHEQIKSLPTSVSMALGVAVEQMQREESIVHMNSGFSVFE